MRVRFIRAGGWEKVVDVDTSRTVVKMQEAELPRVDFRVAIESLSKLTIDERCYERHEWMTADGQREIVYQDVKLRGAPFGAHECLEQEKLAKRIAQLEELAHEAYELFRSVSSRRPVLSLEEALRMAATIDGLAYESAKLIHARAKAGADDALRKAGIGVKAGA